VFTLAIAALELQGIHDLPNSLSVCGSGSEHGDERGEKSRFVRGAEERWERYRVDRLRGERAQGLGRENLQGRGG